MFILPVGKGEIVIFPQTHVYFAEMVLQRTSDTITLGSLLPDMIISANFSHLKAHSIGYKLWNLLKDSRQLADLARGAISHGISPQGLDYFGDEKYPGFERGYCFEKGRTLVGETIDACNIPPQMGWWKAHNIIEMGIECRISALGPYGRTIRKAFNNTYLLDQLGELLTNFIGYDRNLLKARLASFPDYIESFRATPQSLAHKYRVQMYARHRINIDTVKVARLIECAAEQITGDIDSFFRLVHGHVRHELDQLDCD